MDSKPRSPEEYLKLPYARVLVPDPEAGGYTALIVEFPGCIAEGDSSEEALKNLQKAALGWLEASIEMGHDIPQPDAHNDFGGKVALRLPRSLHRRATEQARRDGTSLNQFIVSAVAERVGVMELYGRLCLKVEAAVSKGVASGLDGAAFRPDRAASDASVLKSQTPQARRRERVN